MRKRTQLVGFDFGVYKHVQYIAEFIDNSLDAIEKFQWEELKKRAKGEEHLAFPLDQDISLEKLRLGIEEADQTDDSVELKGGLDKAYAYAFVLGGGEITTSGDDEAEEEPEEEDFGDEGGVPEEVGESEEGDVDSEEESENQQDEIEEIEEEVLEKEVQDILTGLEEFIAPILPMIDDEPFVVIRVREVEADDVLRASMERGGQMYCFEIFDNGTGMIPEDLTKFGKYLASSKSQKLKQTRGSQGFGSPSAFSDAQNTTGKPIVVVSKHASELYATATQFYTTSKNAKKYTFPPAEISVSFNHGTYVKLFYINTPYRRGFADKYIRQTAILNPHVTIIFIEPQTKKKEREAGKTQKVTIFPRLVSKFPEEPTYALPHPGSVNIGDFQDLIRTSENLTVSAFLTENFVRLSSSLAKKIIKTAERGLCRHHAMVQLKNAFCSKVAAPGEPVFYLSEELRVFGRSTKKRKTWVVRVADTKERAEELGPYFQIVGKILELEKKIDQERRKIAKLEQAAENEQVKKTQREIQKEISALQKSSKEKLKEIEKLEAELSKFLVPIAETFPEVSTEDPNWQKLVDVVEEILVSKTKPRDCTRNQIEQIFVAFKEQNYLSPPTDTAIPVGSDVLENVLIKEYGLDIPQRLDYFLRTKEPLEPVEEEDDVRSIMSSLTSPVLAPEGGVSATAAKVPNPLSATDYEEAMDFVEEARSISDDFVAGETRDPTSGKGLAFVVEAAVAISPKIPYARQAQDVLARYVNRTPKLRDNADCAIYQAVARVNWKNYKVETFESGIPRGNIRIFVNVSGPFVHLMFKSQSKNALASDENLMKEIKLCMESIGRRVRAYLNKKVSREKRQKRSSIIIKHVDQFATSLFAMANRYGRFAGKIKKEQLKEVLTAAIGKKEVKPVTIAVAAGVDTAAAPSVASTKADSAPTVETTELVEDAAASVEEAKPAKPVAEPKPVKPAKAKPVKKEPTKRAAIKASPKKKVKKPAKKERAREVKPVEKESPKAARGEVRVGSGRKATKVKPKTEPVMDKPVLRKKAPSVPKPMIIDEKLILENLDDWSTIKDLIDRLNVTTMLDMRFLKMKIIHLEKTKRVLVEIRKGKKYWKRP
ncbi:MAG: hypothetical protein Kow0069_00070 [Promethearchaeota archaeon]